MPRPVNHVAGREARVASRTRELHVVTCVRVYATSPLSLTSGAPCNNGTHISPNTNVDYTVPVHLITAVLAPRQHCTLYFITSYSHFITSLRVQSL